MDFLRSANIAWINRTVASATTLIQTTMAAIYAYMSAVWAGTEDPLWPHLILIPTSVLAGIAVGVGIVFERPKCSEKFQKIGFCCVVVGIAVECVCTVFLFGVDERISNAQQSKIVALESQIIALGPRANLLLDSTGLNPVFITKLKAFAGQKAEVRFCASAPPSPPKDPYFLDNEAIGFSMLLAGALQKANWNSPYADRLECHWFGGDVGVFIRLWPNSSENTKRAAESLRSAIAELPTGAVIGGNAPEQPGTSGDPNSILVLVRPHPGLAGKQPVE